MLVNVVTQSDIAVMLYIGYSTLWHIVTLLLCCIQATQQCGAEQYCCCDVYRVINSVAQSDIALVLYTGYSTVWRRAVLGLYRIQASQHALYNYVYC